MTEADDRSVSVLVDENVERQVLAYLGAEGHEGSHVVDVLEPGAADRSEIAPYAREHDLVIVTKDTDFLAMAQSEHAGVLFIGDHGASAYETATAIMRVIDAVPDRDHLQGVVFVDSWR